MGWAWLGSYTPPFAKYEEVHKKTQDHDGVKLACIGLEGWQMDPEMTFAIKCYAKIISWIMNCKLTNIIQILHQACK